MGWAVVWGGMGLGIGAQEELACCVGRMYVGPTNKSLLKNFLKAELR
jgi:hypothetical protein